MRKILLFSLILLLVAGSVYAVQTVRLAPLTYSIVSKTTTVTTTATAIPATAMVGRENLTISLASTSDTVYIGGSDVTIANGTPLDSNRPAISIDLDDTVVVYGIVSTGTADIRSLEVK